VRKLVLSPTAISTIGKNIFPLSGKRINPSFCKRRWHRHPAGQQNGKRATTGTLLPPLYLHCLTFLIQRHFLFKI
jgi:hypothetical protein